MRLKLSCKQTSLTVIIFGKIGGDYRRKFCFSIRLPILYLLIDFNPVLWGFVIQPFKVDWILNFSSICLEFFNCLSHLVWLRTKLTLFLKPLHAEAGWVDMNIKEITTTFIWKTFVPVALWATQTSPETFRHQNILLTYSLEFLTDCPSDSNDL